MSYREYCHRYAARGNRKESIFPTRFLGILVCLVIGLGTPTQVWAKVYHVDVSRGNDGFPGTEMEPFRTIGRASTVMEPGDKAIIHEGLYHEQIMGGKSGREGASITYEGTDPEKVVLRGSVKVDDWRKVGNVWMKARPRFITHANAFVMVDDTKKLTRVNSAAAMPEGSFFLGPEGIFSIRLWNDADPNIDHTVDVYGLDLGFNAGDRWGGTAKKWIVIKNLTLEKYGTYGISAASNQHEENSNWELDNLTIRYNNGAGVFACCDDWYVHNCRFIRNAIHGCQICGARVRFENNTCQENEWFSHSGYGGAGLLIGAEDWAHSCVIRNNTFLNDGYPDGYGCAIYLEGRSHDNVIENNLIVGSRHAGIGFYGSSYNTAIHNTLVDISPKNAWELTAAFVVDHSREGAPTQSVGNLVAHNTVWGCAAPIAIPEPNRKIEDQEMNRFVNNFFGLCRIMLPAPKQRAAVLERNAWYACPADEGASQSSIGMRLKKALRGLHTGGFKELDTMALVVSDPGFVDPTARNFLLKKGSPLIDAGTVLDAVKNDRQGNPRPAGSLPDIGANEYSGNPKRTVR